MFSNLTNKNILLISPSFFNYEREIQSELERRGAFVYFIDDRIKNSTISKAFIRLKFGESIGKRKLFNYFKKHLEATANIRFDYLIAIVPEGFSKEIIELYKEVLKDTVFILYMWDSIDNRPYMVNTLALYHKIFTFDRDNAKKYGFSFRPLFYTNDYKIIGNLNTETVGYQYDLSFIGTAHSDRYQVIKKLISSSQITMKSFLYFYLQNPILIAYYWVIDPKFRKIKVKDISFKSLSKTEVLDVVSKSRCIIDINHPKQSGLTIRTLEVLGAKRKLITTNPDIINYDFYNPDNILLVDRNNTIINDEFLKKEYQEIDESIYKKYSLSSWISDILS